MSDESSMTGVQRTEARRGRPPGTSARELEVVALRLFAERGFADTTVDDIATGAGVSRRTFFRYFDSKSNVLWGAFDSEVGIIRALLADMPHDIAVMDAVRRAVIEANHYGPADIAELRARMALLGEVPELSASAAVHYDAWERAVSDFVAARTGRPADSLYPLVVGRATLASCRAAYETWATRSDDDLRVYLDAALQALAAGFDDATIMLDQSTVRTEMKLGVRRASAVSRAARNPDA